MIDLHFTDPKNLKQYNCGQCTINVKRQRKCEDDGFENLVGTKQVDEYGLKVNFCPGKATWFESMLILFSECMVALRTGIMPKAGSLEDQKEIFASVFPFFVERWEARQKIRTWSDIHEFTGKIFEVISKMFGGK